MSDTARIKNLLSQIYGNHTGALAFERLAPLIKDIPKADSGPSDYFSEKDVFLITYGDTLIKEGQKPLATLSDFAGRYLKDAVSTIHFLPFFPYSSDDGFSVTDFFLINPQLGTWDEVKSVGVDFELMFDFVINHFSARSDWFRSYLACKPGFETFAIEVDPATDLSMVTRPRSLPLLTEFERQDGSRVHLWTTFSADQIDFNYRSLDVLEKMVEALLFYVKLGATALRLDAIAYLWKEVGTNCIHRPRTHAMVKLFRAILDVVAPQVIIITETNVPHAENISYFGNGRDEAQMVYNFTLPPLLFYTFLKEDATELSRWAGTLRLASESTTFFNFTASHDGIGVRPLEGILPPEEVALLVDAVKSNGGQVSTRRNADGSDSPYELNITYVDAILADPQSDQAKKFLASQSIQYALPGVPATYIHSLLGSRNWNEGVRQTGRARTINREKLMVDSVVAELQNPETFRSKVFHPYMQMIKCRRQQPAFHPNAASEILNIDPKIFAIKRQKGDQTIYALTNVSPERVHFMMSDAGINAPVHDLLTGNPFETQSFELMPYQYVWLSGENAEAA